jgi:phage gp29-like protein
MIYNEFGKPVEDSAVKAQIPAGMFIFPEDSDRHDSDASRALTPSKVDAIMTAANQGNIVEQSKLALELEEKNWDIAQAMETRRNAVLGVRWTVEPGDDTPAAKKAAENFKKALDSTGGASNMVGGKRLDSFNHLRADMLTAIIAGFSVSEIIWKPGGEIAGFQFIKQRHFDYRTGNLKLITTTQPDGIDLAPRKFVVNSYRRRGSDLSRSGLIRPLAWLHCFQNVNFKDLLRFIERYGMPFLVARVDRESWENERNKLKALVRNFGPDGGAVFTKSVETELLQASNNTGDVYFKLLEYTGAAIQKVICGQTASSQGTPGKIGNDKAMSDVRQDYLEADCSTMDDTIDADVADPWNTFNSPAGTPCPKVKHHCEPPEDTEGTATTVKTLYEGGLETDPEEMSQRFGMKLTRRIQPVPPQSFALSAEDRPALDKGGESGAIADNALAKFAGKADKWAGDFMRAVAEFADGKTDSLDMSALSEKFDTKSLTESIEETIYAGIANGKAVKLQNIKKKK